MEKFIDDLKLFENIDLNREQIEIILRRKITDDEWNFYNYYKNKEFNKTEESTKEAAEKTLNFNEAKRKFKSIAKDAAKKGERRKRRIFLNNSDDVYDISKFF